MKCPVCNEKMINTLRQGVEIDFCPNCHGVWLDREELNKIIEHAARQLKEYETSVSAHIGRRFQVYPVPENGRRHFFFEEFFDFN